MNNQLQRYRIRFQPIAFISEFALLLLTSFLGLEFCEYAFIEANYETRAHNVSHVDYQEGSYIYFHDSEQYIAVSPFVQSFCSTSKLYAITEGDIITYQYRNNRLPHPLRALLEKDKIAPVALFSKNLGTIFNYKTFQENHYALWRIIVFLVFGLMLGLVLSLAILYSWILSILLIIDTYKFLHLIDHPLVQHKIISESFIQEIKEKTPPL